MEFFKALTPTPHNEGKHSVSSVVSVMVLCSKHNLALMLLIFARVKALIVPFFLSDERQEVLMKEDKPVPTQPFPRRQRQITSSIEVQYFPMKREMMDLEEQTRKCS